LAVLLVLLLLVGWAGHSLYRYNWRWFAAFQAIAVHCIRRRQHEASFDYQPRATAVIPYLLPNRNLAENYV
jgi:hypothetical protein